ncbi:Glycosyl transferase family 2 [Eubacterium maltosivorans]|uniref:glycosyltransferase n=1 Tax=Eubacterium maltosivorans TaxID=2041044 RepID=UPI000891B520|nr:glycosyltransferase [Eubacterium maltosivorans]WPK80426.1 UDP-Gal:alpha-D-GlcNAc-diphosphoundecaprenol beta-1,3-galactosyltransferase [Eubacterium maltosivorans]SDP89185.1 Glycosyl transferase family 2 [Eubacterium maltosivorans]
MKKYPEFSVLISVYKNDNPKYFKLALESIINQTVKPGEIVLVIDGPVSQSILQIINDTKKSFTMLKKVQLENNMGLGIALQKGLEHCQYELVARMDSDDISVPDRFAQQLEIFMNNKNLSIVGGFVDEFEKDPKKIITQRIVPLEDKDIKRFMTRRNPMNHPTVMFKKQAVLEAGNYQDWHYNEDYYLWIRMSQKGCQFKNINKVLVHMRVGEGMYNRRGGKKYFKSQAKLFEYMKKENIISYPHYLKNIIERYIGQVLMPVNIRTYLYQRVLRQK